MKNLPAFLRKPTYAKGGLLDDVTEDYHPFLGSWLLELALLLKWYRMPRLHQLPDIFVEDDFLTLTGVICPANRDEDGDLTSLTKTTERALIRLLKTRLEVFRRSSIGADLPLFSNIEMMGRLFDLSGAETALIAFAAAMNCFNNFKSVISARNERVSSKRLAQIVAMLTGQPEDGIRAALRDEELLVTTGIITVAAGTVDMEIKLDLGSGMDGLLMQVGANEKDLATRFLKQAGPPTLDIPSFPHLARDIEVVLDYLKNAIAHKVPGSNVLFYGPPGTGKTELVKAIAHALGGELYEIPFADFEGNPIRGEKRLRAYNLCQKLLVRKNGALLMFDEIEDVFEHRGSFWSFLGGDSGSAKGGKAWINRTLERNATPAIWITNDQDIDEAYLRRFDYSVRFPIPPVKVRLQIARHHLKSFSPAEDWLARIASNEHTTPAQMESAAKVARLASGEDLGRARALVEQTLDRSATLLEQKRVPARNLLLTRYDLRFVNTDADVGRLIDGLKQRPRGSFCLYGPAGTGKSELAKQIADEIGKPVLLRRASDLLSKWVGGSEKNIATMFADARQQEAVLVLDEADSFLADRRGARASWEITQVNELLTQMEAFEGIFFCTTNLMQKLDQASLRRFAFKVKFDYLNPEQRWAMFLQELARLGGNMADAPELEDAVRKLACLTPGDFAVAARQLELWGSAATSRGLLEQLRRECAAKEGQSRGIGFTA